VLRFQYNGGNPKTQVISAGIVKAKSRVDARSAIKRRLGIPIKGRLPAGTLIVCLSV
jgi:hypothetical protein